MRRSTPLTLSAACLALAPALTACSLTLGTGPDKSDSPSAAASSSSQPASTSAPATATPTASDSGASGSDASGTTAASDGGTGQAAGSDASTTEPTGTDSTGSDSTGSGSTGSGSGTDTAAGSGTQGAADTGEGAARQHVTVPAGMGISRLDVVDVYGSSGRGTGYGKGVGILTVANDGPVMLKMRIRLFDAAGRQVASNEGLNASYTVGTHHLVTSNLVKMPAGQRPASFKVDLLGTTPMRNGFSITRFGKPVATRTARHGSTQVLTGTATYSGQMTGSVDAKGACVLPDGTIYQGTDSLVDNPKRANGASTTVTYEIPLYDADGADLSRARCYASA